MESDTKSYISFFVAASGKCDPQQNPYQYSQRHLLPMTNQYYYQSLVLLALLQQYSPPISNGMTMDTSSSPIFNYDSLGSSISSLSSSYLFHNPRLRYYLSKSFDIEDDMEFCPEINTESFQHSPTVKKFNAFTASVFSPTAAANAINDTISPVNHQPASPRVGTPRLRKPIEIINPQTKMRVGSPAISK